VVDLLNEYINELEHYEPTLGRTMKFHLSNFEKDIDLSGAFDFQNMLSELLLENVSYLTVFWGIMEGGNSKSSGNIISDLQDAFVEIGRRSGGTTVSGSEPEDGLMSLKEYTDHFYELVFEYEGDPADTKIQVDVNGSNPVLSYRGSFSMDEMDSWINRIFDGKITISDFSLKKRRNAAFTLSGFERDKINRFGMLKVRISLLDEDNQLVYTESNIMRASEGEVDVSVPVPKEYKGEYTLVIDAIDMMANKIGSITNRVTIK
jgi:hypothetical protein